MYYRLGSHWEANLPSEVDQAAVYSLERLAAAPIRLSDLRDQVRDPDTLRHMLEIGEAAQFARRIRRLRTETRLSGRPSVPLSSSPMRCPRCSTASRMSMCASSSRAYGVTRGSRSRGTREVWVKP